MRIDSIPAAAAAASASPARTPEVTNQDAEAPSTSVRELGQGIKVTLSERAQAKASASKADQAVEELSSLNSALTTAYASLAQAMDGDSLSDEQKQQAMSLSMA